MTAIGNNPVYSPESLIYTTQGTQFVLFWNATSLEDVYFYIDEDRNNLLRVLDFFSIDDSGNSLLILLTGNTEFLGKRLTFIRFSVPEKVITYTNTYVDFNKEFNNQYYLLQEIRQDLSEFTIRFTDLEESLKTTSTYRKGDIAIFNVNNVPENSVWVESDGTRVLNSVYDLTDVGYQIEYDIVDYTYVGTNRIAQSSSTRDPKQFEFIKKIGNRYYYLNGSINDSGFSIHYTENPEIQNSYVQLKSFGGYNRNTIIMINEDISYGVKVDGTGRLSLDLIEGTSSLTVTPQWTSSFTGQSTSPNPYRDGFLEIKDNKLYFIYKNTAFNNILYISKFNINNDYSLTLEDTFEYDGLFNNVQVSRFTTEVFITNNNIFITGSSNTNNSLKVIRFDLNNLENNTTVFDESLLYVRSIRKQELGNFNYTCVISSNDEGTVPSEEENTYIQYLEIINDNVVNKFITIPRYNFGQDETQTTHPQYYKLINTELTYPELKKHGTIFYNNNYQLIIHSNYLLISEDYFNTFNKIFIRSILDSDGVLTPNYNLRTLIYSTFYSDGFKVRNINGWRTGSDVTRYMYNTLVDLELSETGYHTLPDYSYLNSYNGLNKAYIKLTEEE